MAGSTTESESQSSPQEEADLEELTWYEKRLEAILAQMDGAGKVQVMITESVSRESIVEKDQTVQRQMNRTVMAVQIQEKASRKIRKSPQYWKKTDREGRPLM